MGKCQRFSAKQQLYPTKRNCLQFESIFRPHEIKFQDSSIIPIHEKKLSAAAFLPTEVMKSV